jgi:hypothetical protein
VASGGATRNGGSEICDRGGELDLDHCLENGDIGDAAGGCTQKVSAMLEGAKSPSSDWKMRGKLENQCSMEVRLWTRAVNSINRRDIQTILSLMAYLEGSAE